MSFDRVLFGLHNRGGARVHAVAPPYAPWRAAPAAPAMHVAAGYTVGEGSSPPGGVMPPASASDFTPSPAPAATSSRWPLVLLGLATAGAVVYVYQHVREDETRFRELEREFEHSEPHHQCSCGRESPAANVYEHTGYRPA